MNNSLVSIIIPTFNAERHLKETLESVNNQTYTNWECILVDDISTDNTVTLINNFLNLDKRFKKLIRESSRIKGPSSCRNIGINKSNGDFVVFLDSDDLLADNCLKNRVENFIKYPKNDFLVFQVERFKKLNLPCILKQSEENIVNQKEAFYSFLEMKSVWQTTCPIYKKDFIKNLGGFNENLTVFTDLELGLRATYKSNFILIPVIDCYYRNDENYFKKKSKLDFRNRVIKSFYFYCISFNENIINNVSDLHLKKIYKRLLVGNFKRIFNYYSLSLLPSNLSYNKKAYNYLVFEKYLNIKEIIVYGIINYFLLPLNRINSYKLMKLIKKTAM